MTHRVIVSVFLIYTLSGCTSVEPTDSHQPIEQQTERVGREPNGIYDGETIEIACNKFIDTYFEDDDKEGKVRPYHGLTLVEESDSQARIRFYVYYKIWGYDEELVLEKKSDKWIISRLENFRNLDFE